MRWIDNIGASFLGFFKYIFYLFALFYLCLKVVWTNRDLGQRAFFRQVFLQIYYTGVQGAAPIITLALGVGVFVIVTGVGGIGALSGVASLGKLVTVIVLREVAPLLAGGVVIVRSVTAIAAELGVMRVQREIEAIEAMGLSPIRQLITPRIFGGVMALFGLNILFSAVALSGGYLLARLMVSIPASVFFRSIFLAITPMDIVGLALKITIGGIGVFVIACYHGMSVGRSSTEVPVAVSKAALNSLVFMFVFYVGISIVTFMYSEAGGMIGGLL